MKEELFRPRNGDQLLWAMAEGKTCEVPDGYGMKSLRFLESRLSNWSVFYGESPNNGWCILRPTDDTPRQIQRYLEKLKGGGETGVKSPQHVEN